MDRSEHLTWAKSRALEYLDAGDPQNAVQSMLSDLTKHEDLAGHPGIMLGGMLLLGGHLTDERAVRDWVTGFN